MTLAMIKPVERINLTDQVFKQLRDKIIGDGFSPGARLPSERQLCDLLRVNRSSVREALKRLEQAHLIEIRHGEGSVVLDFRLTAGFELLGDLVSLTAAQSPAIVRSILEFRALIGPESARLAALRITASDLKEVALLVERIEACDRPDVSGLQDLDFEFHYTLARASENLALLLIFNSVRDIYLELRSVFTVMFEQAMRSRSVYRRIYNALEAGDPKRAQKLCKRFFEESNQVWREYYQRAGGGVIDRE